MDHILARTITGEARSQGEQGMIDVACVILTRSQIAAHYVEAHGKPHPLFGDGTPESACLVEWQFSCWDEGDPNRVIIENISDKFGIFQDALAIEADALAGNLVDRTQRATHYQVIGTDAPWSRGHAPCYTYLQHAFYNDIP